MSTNTLRNTGLVAVGAWLVTPGYGLWNLIKAGDDDWEIAYGILGIAVLVGAVLTLMVAAALTRGSARPGLRVAGLVVGGLGTVLAVVGTWATVVWLPVLGVAFALLAAAAPATPVRRTIAVLAGGMLAGFAIMMVSAFAADEVTEVGELLGFVALAAGAVASLGRWAVSPEELVAVS